MLPPDFHPVIRHWWDRHFRVDHDGETRVLPPTEAQLEGWRAIRDGEHTLIAAPTGSGKTLAAFLTSIDELLREGLERGDLPDEVRVIYVSPLKALSADIHKNLAEPRREIKRIAEDLGYPPVRISAAVRSGDTPQSDRAAMLRTPPHILVTTPESLYLLLTAERSRAMLRSARVVIVDEIHAVIESRRGAHLALSLERLDHVCGRRLQRIGLSATQKPIEQVAEFLVGAGKGRTPEPVAIVNRGHKRAVDLQIEIPGSPLEAVMAGEVWQEIYNRLVQLIEEHRTTLLFVNTRRLAERMAFNLSERLGSEFVAAHHGSLSKDVRLDAEERLRNGQLKVLVATASLELGIDIGHVDLVCQISSPHRIATLLQRVGRSGHTVGGLPKGRIFPLTRDDLLECAAMVHALKSGELDRVIIPEKPLDVLAQQIVAEAAAEEWDEAALYELLRRAYPYQTLTREEYENALEMLSRGYTTRRGRRAALIHYDAINHKVRGRNASRLTAIQSGGAIPEVFDFRVLLEPDGVFIGTLNEDFAIESLAGDVFQLGNTSWRILRVGNGVVRVADAEGQPPSMPFWLGEAPARSDEMSAAVSALRERADALLPGPDTARAADDYDTASEWLMREY
jgi:ATP-dependent Lhr-like helicase